AIARCRTAALGGHVDECTRCGHRAISFNSCRNRHCPKCQAGARDRWLAARRQELLSTRYVHVVFTLPRHLAPLVLQNKKVIYDLLFRTSAETLLEVARDPQHLGAEIGFFSVLHSLLKNSNFTRMYIAWCRPVGCLEFFACFDPLRTALPCSGMDLLFQLLQPRSSRSFFATACFGSATVRYRALPHSLGTTSRRSFPPLNLHNDRVRRNHGRLPSSRCIESARTHRARVCALPHRASDTILRLLARFAELTSPSSRRARRPCGRPALSELGVKVSLHPAQALRTPLGDAASRRKDADHPACHDRVHEVKRSSWHLWNRPSHGRRSNEGASR